MSAPAVDAWTGAPAGPVIGAVRRILAGAGIAGAEIGWAERSPLGPSALRVRCAGGDAPLVPPALDREGVIDAVAVRPPNAYVRPTTGALCRWVGDSAAPALAVAPAGGIADVRAAVADADESLTAVRVRAVAQALARLLSAGAGGGDGQMSGNELVVGPSGIDVGAVDVPHGPLRSRYGGALAGDDLADALARGHGDRSVIGSSVAAVMLRDRRSRRLVLDEARIAGAVHDVALVREAMGVARAGGMLGGIPGDAARPVAIEIDRAPATLAVAARRLDPSYALAALRSLAGTVVSARGAITPGHGLWRAAAPTLDLLAEIVLGPHRLERRTR